MSTVKKLRDRFVTWFLRGCYFELSVTHHGRERVWKYDGRVAAQKRERA